MKSLKIGSLKLKNNLVLAPMFDVTDLPFRLLCRGGYSALSDNLRSAPRRPERPDPPPQKGQRNNSGCGLAYTEMIYVDALLHENEKTKQMTKTCKGDSPLGLQITGNDVKEFKEFVSRRKLWEKFELIDLNCGCPSMRIVGTRAGSYLLKDPEKIAAIVRILKLTKKPVTVKIRLGFRENNVLRLARIIEGAGADAIIVHARLAVDGNDVKADWKWIARVKKIVKIPVIGNGDVFSGDDAFRMMKETGCDGVMIGRGAIGNPLIFKRVLEYFK
ncbi:MAG: tRNA-dihydrouridine synthase family protein, partial [Nanoarchaeota archaeon]|nr:tRNA-dihydrouridine synthase family protein [Nanoarchaeota archaeon]